LQCLFSPLCCSNVHQDTDIFNVVSCPAPDAPALLLLDRAIRHEQAMRISMFCARWTPVQRLAPALMRHLDGFAGAQIDLLRCKIILIDANISSDQTCSSVAIFQLKLPVR